MNLKHSSVYFNEFERGLSHPFSALILHQGIEVESLTGHKSTLSDPSRGSDRTRSTAPAADRLAFHHPSWHLHIKKIQLNLADNLYNMHIFTLAAGFMLRSTGLMTAKPIECTGFEFQGRSMVAFKT